MVGMKIDKYDLLDFAISTTRAAKSFGEEGISSIDFRACTDVTLSKELFDSMGFDNVENEKGETSDIVISAAKYGGILFTCYRFPEADDGGE